MPSWLDDVIRVGRELLPVGAAAYQAIRERRRKTGDRAPARIPDVNEEIERRASERRRWRQQRWPEG